MPQTPSSLPVPRQGPRPLGLHLATEGWILQMSFAALLTSNGASPLSRPLHRLLAESAPQNQPNPDWRTHLAAVPFVDALTREAKARLDGLVAGVARYHSHPYRRERSAPPPVWMRGPAVLRDYGGADTAPPALFVPSLVNRAYILDLAEDRSLMDFAATHGMRAYLLDWGAPGNAEKNFDAGDYVQGVLIPALEHIAATHKTAPRLVGYCMGGTLAAAAAALRPDLISSLALLATPWDFHAESDASRALMATYKPAIEAMIATLGVAPVDFLQAMFASLDPTLVGRKFRGFAGRDADSDGARRFVELEDWLNDGVDLAGPLARECLFEWYGENRPYRGEWTIEGTRVDPARILAPALAVIPTADRIVPPASARALAAQIPACRTLEIALGHIGMMAGGSAGRALYEPLLSWLRAPTAA